MRGRDRHRANGTAFGIFEEGLTVDVSRRGLLMAAGVGATLLSLPRASAQAAMGLDAQSDNDAVKLIERTTGKTPTLSHRVHLDMPKSFPNGYTVPLAFDIDSPMTDADHVRSVRVVAPKNPLIEVATFHFMPGRSQARVATRIRLAEPQFVLAVAEMNDGALLMAKTWVDVASDGCK